MGRDKDGGEWLSFLVRGVIVWVPWEVAPQRNALHCAPAVDRSPQPTAPEDDMALALAALETPAEPKEHLVKIVETRSLVRNSSVKLASGVSSSYYFDMKKTLFDPHGIALVSELILLIARQRGIRFVGGLEMGAVPIAAGVALLSSLDGKPTVHGIFVRKAAKEHGTRQTVEGIPFGESLEGKEVLVVDDVLTTGGSALRAVMDLRAAGASVRTLVAVVDRLAGAREACHRENVDLIALTDLTDYDLP